MFAASGLEHFPASRFGWKDFGARAKEVPKIPLLESPPQSLTSKSAL